MKHLLILSAVLLGSCGSKSGGGDDSTPAPTTPTVTPSPAPTPTPAPAATTTKYTQSIPDGTYKLSSAVKTTTTGSTDYSPTGNTYRYAFTFDSSTDYYTLEITGSATFPPAIWDQNISIPFGCLTGSKKYKLRFSDKIGDVRDFDYQASSTCKSTDPMIEPDTTSNFYINSGNTTIRVVKGYSRNNYEYSFTKE